MATSPIVQMVQDPDFSKLSPIEQRKALAAHDPIFSGADSAAITQFVRTHRADAQQKNIRNFQADSAQQPRIPVRDSAQPASNPFAAFVGGAAKQAGGALVSGGMEQGFSQGRPEDAAQFQAQLKQQGKSPWNPLNYLGDGSIPPNLGSSTVEGLKEINPLAPVMNDPSPENAGRSLINALMLVSMLRGSSPRAGTGPGALMRAAASKLNPDVVGIVSPRIGNIVRVVKRNLPEAAPAAPAANATPVAAQANELMRLRNPELFGGKPRPAAARAARVEEILKAAKGSAPAPGSQPAAAAASTVDAAELVSAGRNLGLRPEEAQARAREAVSQFPNDRDAAIQYMAGRKTPAATAAKISEIRSGAQARVPVPQRTDVPSVSGGSSPQPIKISVDRAEDLADIKARVDMLRQELALQKAPRGAQAAAPQAQARVPVPQTSAPSAGTRDVTASRPGSAIAEVNTPARSYVAKNKATMQRMEDAAKVREELAARGVVAPTGASSRAADAQASLVQSLQQVGIRAPQRQLPPAVAEPQIIPPTRPEWTPETAPGPHADPIKSRLSAKEQARAAELEQLGDDRTGQENHELYQLYLKATPPTINASPEVKLLQALQETPAGQKGGWGGKRAGVGRKPAVKPAGDIEPKDFSAEDIQSRMQQKYGKHYDIPKYSGGAPSASYWLFDDGTSSGREPVGDRQIHHSESAEFALQTRTMPLLSIDELMERTRAVRVSVTKNDGTYVQARGPLSDAQVTKLAPTAKRFTWDLLKGGRTVKYGTGDFRAFSKALDEYERGKPDPGEIGIH